MIVGNQNFEGVGWIGPYGVADMAHREADPITIDHIIALRKEILELEKKVEKQDQYIENILNQSVAVWAENVKLRGQINDLTGANDTKVEADLTIR